MLTRRYVLFHTYIHMYAHTYEKISTYVYSYTQAHAYECVFYHHPLLHLLPFLFHACGLKEMTDSCAHEV